MSGPLGGLRLDRITEVPLLGGAAATDGQRLSALRHGLLPGFTRAHAAGEGVAIAWTRAAAGASLDVYATPGYLPGVTASPADDLPDLPTWVACTGSHDALTVVPDADRDDEPRGVLEDLVAQLDDEPFAWLVWAEPVPADDARAQLDDLHYSMTVLLDRESGSGRDAIELERVRERYRELASAIGGIWRVRVLAGGDSASGARQAAALLAAAADLHPTAYVLLPSPDAGGLADALAAPPIMASGVLLAAVGRPPMRELPGLRAVERARFDVTPETPGDGVPLGDVLDEAGRAVGTFHVPPATLNRHAFVAGATGSGKSQTIRHLLEGLHAARIPWLVIEPVKAEYAGMAGRLADDRSVAVVRPGDPGAVPLCLNPLEPEPGFPLQTHLDLVRALFLAAFEAHEPFPQVLAQALTRCYTEAGWDLTVGEAGSSGGRYPRLGDLQRTARRVVEDIGYGAELAADVRGFVDVRLNSLRLGSAGRFLEGGYPLDVADLLARNTVLELEDIGNDQDKSFCIGVVLIRLTEHLRVRAAGEPAGGGERLRHVTVVEEAHRLLKASAVGTPVAHAVELFASLLAEIRAYGEGVLVAEQIPSKLLPDVVKNSALKVVHRLPAADDREVIGATMNLSEQQSRAVVWLPPGQAAAFADGMDRPVLVRVPLGEARERRADPPATVALAGDEREPCTLREIAAALRLAEDPRLVLWVELLTIAHVTGDPRPVPREGALADVLGERPRRVVEYALALLAASAAQSRTTALRRWYRPHALSQHVTDVSSGMLCDGLPPCDPLDEVGWQAGCYRWIDVARELRNWPSSRVGPHPDTEEWAARGLRLPEATIDAQLAALRRDSSFELSDAHLLRGDADPSAVDRAAAALSSRADASERLSDAARFLTTQSESILT
jgi:hypothetical protein